MERLTRRCNGVVVYVGSERQNDTGDIPCEVSTQGVREILVRLAEYEDALLSPDEIVKIGTEAKAGCVKAIARMYAVDINRLRELAGADREGRVVALPKKGSTVYYIGGACGLRVVAGVVVNSNLESLKARVMPAARDYLVEVPVSSLYTSREEAETALERMKCDGN